MPLAAALPYIAAVTGVLGAVSTLQQSRAAKKAASQPAIAPLAIEPEPVAAVAAEPIKEVVQPTIAADTIAAQEKADQETAQKKLAQRRAARANSLLSSAGGAGDISGLLTEQPSARGKLTLGG